VSRTTRIVTWLSTALLLMPALAISPAFGQTRSMYSNQANPSIGMNALFSAQAAHNLDEPYGIHFDEAEISLIAVVDPYWTLVSNIVFAPDGVDPEEVWARSTNIPAIQLKLGKIRGTFGKHGLLHTHAFPFIQAPVIMANTIGEEGFKAAGAEAAWLTPLPWYAELTGGIYEPSDSAADQPLDFGSTRHDNIPYLGHFKNQIDLNDETTLELGVSALSGRGSDDRAHSAFGGDATVRNVPLRTSNSRGWILQGEYLERGESAPGGYARESSGWYASYQYRLSQVWWAGIRGEQARDSFTDFLLDSAGLPVPGKVSRGSVNLAWMPSEFSFVRIEYSHAEGDAGSGIKPNDDRVMLQLSYTIGYHPAHAY
jgi:hypothetical protein